MQTEMYECKTIKLHGLPDELRLIGGFNDDGELMFVHARKPKRHWQRQDAESVEAFHARVIADLAGGA